MKSPVSLLKREELETKIMRSDPGLMEILLSKERTLLSRERTVIAISQLALGITALGVVIVRFFGDVGYEWFVPLGLGLVMISGFLFYHSLKDYKHLQKKLYHLHESRGHLDKIYYGRLKNIEFSD